MLSLKKAREVTLATAISLPGMVGHEALINIPYIDSVGKKTVCVGETEGIEDRFYSDAECLIMLANRVAKDYEAPIARCVGNWVDFPLEVRVASIHLAYNIGVKGYCGSSIARNLRQGNLRKACEAHMLWNKGRINGRLVEIKGLTNRRTQERDFCLEGVTGAV